METIIDSGKISILTALDMSAAFDTLEHIKLLLRLQHTFGLSGYVIPWIRSYLTDRSSFVKIDSSSSPPTTILTGMPQGSVLGPLLFVLSIWPIANVINSDQSNHNNIVSLHQYADDTQLYIGTNSSTLTSQIASENPAPWFWRWPVWGSDQKFVYYMTIVATLWTETTSNKSVREIVK